MNELKNSLTRLGLLGLVWLAGFNADAAMTNSLSLVTNTNSAKKTYIVTLRREADQDGCVNEHQVKRGLSWRHALNGFTADLDDAAVGRLRKDSRVLAVEENAPVAPSLITIAQVRPTGIKRVGADFFPESQIMMRLINSQTNLGINVDVAILDTGIDNTHPDLNVVQMAGFADAGYNGFDWNGHGTHVAGIVGAINNAIGVVGVAPGVRLWSVQVLGPTQSSFDNVIAGLNYIAQHTDQISVVNASLGPSTTNSPIVAIQQAVQAIVNQGVVFVAAAGNNNGQDIAGPDGVFGTADDFIPAALPEVMAVSAMDPVTNIIASFSNSCRSNKVPNTDPRYVDSPGNGIDVAAPGVNITSTYLTSTSGYGTSSGTSMASPHVAGLVALYIAANGRATNAAGVYKIRQAIVNASQPQSQWMPRGIPFDATNNPTGDPDGNPEPLAVASTNWIPSPRIISQSRTNGTVQISFPAIPGYSYNVQYRNALGAAGWTNLFGSIMGTGSITNVMLADSNPDAQSRFYRVAMASVISTNAGSGVSGWFSLCYAFGFGATPGDPGIIGNSYRFSNQYLLTNGLGSHVDFVSNVISSTGPFTVEFWVKPAQLVNDLFCPAATVDSSQNGGTSRYGWIFYQTANNQWQFRVGGANGYVATINGGTVQANVWEHIAGVYDGANISLYVNGQLVAGPTAASGFSQNLTQPLRFGAASDGTRTFDGWLDEPAIYTKALSAAQISAHFNAATTNNAGYGTQILGDGPVGYWHFD